MPVRVMIVEDSPTMTRMLTALISSDKRLTVVGSAPSGEVALSLVKTLEPDVISMDLQLPGISGLDTVREIMAESPTPLVVVAHDVDGSTFEALRCGVLSLVEKPAGSGAPYQAACRAICDQLFLMSGVKVLRYRPQKSVPLNASQAKLERDRSTPAFFEVLGIGGGPGSTPALTRLLGTLPRRFELPILLGMATPEQVGVYLQWLQTMTSLPVRVAAEGEIPFAGYIYISPPEHQLLYTGKRLRLQPLSPEPANALFQSLQETGQKAIGVLLMGVTNDGTSGLHALRVAGGQTLWENDSTMFAAPETVDPAATGEHRMPVSSMARYILQLLR